VSTRTARGLRCLFLFAVLRVAPGCADGAPPTVEGRLAIRIADRDDGRSETQYFVTPVDGLPRRLLFDRAPAGAATGVPIRVWGDAAGDTVAVTRFELNRSRNGDGVGVGVGVGLDERRADLLAGPALPVRTFAFVLVNTGSGVNLTTAQATQELFDAGYFAANKGSIRRYYQEVSYGLQDITGTVVGPLSYAPASSCDTDGVLSLRDQVDAMVGGPSTNYLWYFGSFQRGCNWSGLATLGSPTSPTRDTWYNAAAGCIVLAQEPGHNFGMQHSSSMRCGVNAPFVDVPDGTCTHDEYGDPYDPMGSGCRHMNAWQKEYQGWLSGCNSVRLAASGTFTLLPLETPCDGIQVLQVPMPHPRTFTYTSTGGFSSGQTADELSSYYVELRAETSGFDQGMTPQVQVRVGGDYQPHAQSGLHTWLLDMKPATSSFSDAALAVGQTFTDPAGGVSITATAVGAASATVTVTIDNGQGDPTCLDGTTLVAPGPPSCAGTGAGGTGGPAGAAGTTGSAGAAGAVGSTGAGGSGGPGGGAGGLGTGGAPAGTGGDTGGSGAGTDAGPPGETMPGGCGCALADRRGPGPSSLCLPFALLIASVRGRRRSRRRALATAAVLSTSLLVLACSNSEPAGTSSGGAGRGSAAGAGGATSGAGGAPAGAGGADGGASGSGAIAGTAGTGNTGGSSAGADGGVSWSCVEAAGALCFCDLDPDGGGTTGCVETWTCCFAAATSCECLDDQQGCDDALAMNAGTRSVPRCPP
jgi:hypothetical protein